ncbi:hypothetical protein HPB48_003794 [Haemaphysalis longicornis]|uniref:Uncharacterized protein n=1 Tax=Haemaphysalis longicornis TaxID=44386 RepID=A0A9J6FFP2_HAELO|nr:hypothetical protein HPB48_003794 [Haemaphysalis longicornis]
MFVEFMKWHWQDKENSPHFRTCVRPGRNTSVACSVEHFGNPLGKLILVFENYVHATEARDVSLQPEFSLGTAMTSSVMLSYLQARVARNPGIKVRELPGHMAQLPAKIRAENVANEIAIRKFIKEHPEVFEIDKNDSVFVRPAVAKDVTSGVLLSHLQKCLETNQGIKLNELPGYLDPLPREVREKHCANDSAIRSFIEKHSEAFIIDSSDRVFIQPKPATTVQAPVEGLTELCNVSGQIYRTLPARRFIGVEKPIKTTIYFGVKQFEDGRHSDVHSAGVAVGPDSVVLDATRTSGHKAPLKATHVRRVKPVVVKRAPRLTPLKVEPESGDDLYNQPGVIHTVKPSFGFITFGPKKKRNCSFFHSSVVEKTIARSCKDLADIFTVGDRVRFDAVPNTKPSKWVKWKATSVWHSFPEDDAASYQEKGSASEVFMSEGEDIEELLNGCSSLDFSDGETEDYPVGIPDWEGPKARTTGGSQEPSDPEAHVPWTTRQKLSGVKAAFVRVTERTGQASWLDEDIFVHVIIDVVYRNGKQIKSFEELYEGSTFKSVVDVYIDAVKAREDLWVATLVWTGNRPAKLHVSLSENIFNRILAETVREKELSGQHSTEGASHSSADASRASLAAAPSDSQLSITICPGSKGIVTDIQQRVATCSVQESGKLRDLQFTSFYKDGTAYMYNLDKALKKGDAVSLEYMVGVSQGKEEVHCDLVWQGQKPSGVLQLSPEDFAERLNNPAPSQSNTPMPRATKQLLPDPPKVCSGVTRDGTCKPLLSTAQLLQASGIVMINAAGQQLTIYNPQVVAGDGDKRTPPRTKSPHHEGSEPSVFIYEGAKGTIVRALESVAWAEVWEAGSSLEVEFMSGCFYQDGEVVLEDLNEVLARGDEVTLDYMVNSSTGSRTKKVVHCDLVWRGRKPRKTAGRLAPDEFVRKLNIAKPCEGVVASFDDLSSQV